MKISTIKKIIENIPDDYTILYDKKKTTILLNDKFKIDIKGKYLILK